MLYTLVLLTPAYHDAQDVITKLVESAGYIPLILNSARVWMTTLLSLFMNLW